MHKKNYVFSFDNLFLSFCIKYPPFIGMIEDDGKYVLLVFTGRLPPFLNDTSSALVCMRSIGNFLVVSVCPGYFFNLHHKKIQLRR